MRRSRAALKARVSSSARWPARPSTCSCIAHVFGRARITGPFEHSRTCISALRDMVRNGQVHGPFGGARYAEVPPQRGAALRELAGKRAGWIRGNISSCRRIMGRRARLDVDRPVFNARDLAKVILSANALGRQWAARKNRLVHRSVPAS